MEDNEVTHGCGHSSRRECKLLALSERHVHCSDDHASRRKIQIGIEARLELKNG
jgi:hypothetical protein